MIKEEIVQLVGADDLLGFLADLSFRGRQELGADRGVQDRPKLPTT
jgi:hypothetical protein